MDLPFATRSVVATNHTSFIVSEEGKLYTWPVGDWMNKEPFEVSVPV